LETIAEEKGLDIHSLVDTAEVKNESGEQGYTYVKMSENLTKESLQKAAESLSDEMIDSLETLKELADNLSSEELGDPLVTLSDADFKINEELKTLSTKKILVSSKKLNPGDKFIVTSNNINYNKNNIKLSVVSIEDGGKITYLDSEIKEY
jgi:RecJ-like exonuclease